MRAARAFALGSAILLATALLNRAQAGQLTVSDAESCVDAGTLADQVSELLGRPLDSVMGR